MGSVVIAGCGYVGTRLGEILTKEGHQVSGIRRSENSLPPSFRLIQADLTDPSSLKTIDLSFDLAVYCAAADARTELAYDHAYVVGLQNFLTALKEISPNIRRVVFASSTGVYGQDDGGWVDEESDTKPESFTGKKVLEGESVLLDSGLPGIVVRFGGIYGPGRTRLIAAVREGRVALTESPAFTNRIHREDCARSVSHLLKIKNPRTIYNGVDSLACDRNEVHAWLAVQLGVQLEKEPVPSVRPPSGKRCRNERLIASGFKFVYPSFREGYTEVISNRNKG